MRGSGQDTLATMQSSWRRAAHLMLALSVVRKLKFRGKRVQLQMTTCLWRMVSSTWTTVIRRWVPSYLRVPYDAAHGQCNAPQFLHWHVISKEETAPHQDYHRLHVTHHLLTVTQFEEWFMCNGWSLVSSHIICSPASSTSSRFGLMLGKIIYNLLDLTWNIDLLDCSPKSSLDIISPFICRIQHWAFWASWLLQWQCSVKACQLLCLSFVAHSCKMPEHAHPSFAQQPLVLKWMISTCSISLL